MEQQGGVLGFLDGLVNTAVNASVSAAQIKANLKGPSTSDQTKVGAVSGVQAAGFSIPTLWIVGGVGLVVLAVVLLRRK